jgi:hypothetical protein
MDLTTFMRNLSGVLANYQPAAEKPLSAADLAALETTLDSLGMKLDYLIKNVNGAAAFKLPEAAADAREL